MFSQQIADTTYNPIIQNPEYELGKGHAGSATAFSALIDDAIVCKLNNRRYSVHQVSPGKHEFKAQFGGKKGKKKAEIALIEIEAGKTYYVQMIMQASFWVNDVSARRSQEIPL